MTRDVEGDAGLPRPVVAPAQRVPPLLRDTQRVDDPDPGLVEAASQALPDLLGQAPVCAVDEQDDSLHPVLAGRGDQEVHDLRDLPDAVARAGEVKAGVERLGSAEGEHHDRVGGQEAQHDWAEGQEVFG